ncbi:DUF4194 domain-containing protein [Photorhabdus temperata]|uniref:DUF4194 domain-containing protein n=1 Tax=Photorhabdus temperata J3 TaxID=1389415 RepID=U7R391_PHOTE|nr:DUF4194 domain-containing protein [Photorhabdus temperata]ERT14165.1 hypothetical protein O185_04845 [Photorhabdus temperata J3]
MHKDKKLNKDRGTPATLGKSDSDPQKEQQTGFFDQLIKHHTQSEYNPLTDTTGVESAVAANKSSSVEVDDVLVSDHPESSNSGMPPDARRVLVSLLRQGVILSSQKAKLFESLCRYQCAVRKHLSEVYLKLVLDEKAGVAFIAGFQNEEDTESLGIDGEEVVSLISRRTLSLYDTLLLLVLRKHYQDRETSGEQRIIIDIERIESHLTPFLPLTNSTKSDRRKLKGALEKMVTKKILSSVRGSEDRFEITPVIRYVVSAEFLENMLNEYLKMAGEKGIELTKNGSNAVDYQDEEEETGDEND